jgi:hypothetical protein
MQRRPEGRACSMPIPANISLNTCPYDGSEILRFVAASTPPAAFLCNAQTWVGAFEARQVVGRVGQSENGTLVARGT